MTFKLQGPVTQGYGDIVNQSGKVLGQIPSLQNTMQTRMAAIGLEEEARNQILDNELKMMKLGVTSQQPQKKQGFGWEQALGLGSQIFGAASGAGLFSGGGAAANYSPTGAPGFGAENVDWMSMPGYFGNPG